MAAEQISEIQHFFLFIATWLIALWLMRACTRVLILHDGRIANVGVRVRVGAVECQLNTLISPSHESPAVGLRISRLSGPEWSYHYIIPR